MFKSSTFTAPSLTESDSDYRSLVERERTLSDELSAISRQIRAVEADIGARPAPAVRPGVAALLGEVVDADLLERPARLKGLRTRPSRAAARTLNPRWRLFARASVTASEMPVAPLVGLPGPNTPSGLPGSRQASKRLRRPTRMSRRSSTHWSARAPRLAISLPSWSTSSAAPTMAASAPSAKRRIMRMRENVDQNTAPTERREYRYERADSRGKRIERSVKLPGEARHTASSASAIEIAKMLKRKKEAKRNG